MTSDDGNSSEYDTRDNSNSSEYDTRDNSFELFVAKDTGITKNPLILSANELENVSVKFDQLINVDDRRASERLHCKGNLVFYGPTGRIVGKGLIRDFSRGGVSVEALPSKLELNDSFIIEFSVTPTITMSQIKCRVKRISAVAGDALERIKIGIEFCNLTAIQMKRLAAFSETLKTSEGFTATDR
jgi:hypothetical protein